MAEGELQRDVLRVDPRESAARVRRVRSAVCAIARYHIVRPGIHAIRRLSRYGLPVNFQAILLQPNKKSTKRLRDVLNQLYSHLDGSAAAPSASADVCVPTGRVRLHVL